MQLGAWALFYLSLLFGAYSAGVSHDVGWIQVFQGFLRDWQLEKTQDTDLSLLTKLRIFFCFVFYKCSLGYCQIMVYFQTLKTQILTIFSNIAMTFIEEKIIRGQYSMTFVDIIPMTYIPHSMVLLIWL